MKILHVLANSPPDLNGYAVRTHSLLVSQKKITTIEPFAVTSPWYPERESMAKEFCSDDIRYHRTIHPAHLTSNHGLLNRWVANRGKSKIKRARKKKLKESQESKSNFFSKALIFLKYRAIRISRIFVSPIFTLLEEKVLQKQFRQRIIEVAQNVEADVIHAHTPYRVGMPAFAAARQLNLPFVYEMRGMWEETAVGSGRWKSWGLAYSRFRRIETRLLKRADAVICICETLREEAISRGVNPSNITLVHNAVSESDIEPVESELLHQSRTSLNVSKETLVVGYIGSLRTIEGVDQTADAVAILAKKGLDIRFFALTSSEGQIELRKHCESLGIGNQSVIVGPVPHNQVTPFYNLIDVFVISRPNTRVTSLVTPLKPFEAMLAGCPILASDLPALAEIVDDGKTGILFSADNISDLSEKIEMLNSNPEMRNNLGKSAKEWVLENRTWDLVVDKGLKVYEVAKYNNPKNSSR